MAAPPPSPDASRGALQPRTRGRYHRTWIMLALVLGVAAVALVVMERGAAPPIVIPPGGVEGAPEVYMKGAMISQFRPDGGLQYELAADEIRYFEGQALTRLVRPRMTLFHEHRPPWEVRALEGSVQRPPPGAGEEEIYLKEDVVLEQVRSDGERLRFSTPALYLYPGRQYAQTDQNVMIDGEFGQTTATGLEGNLQLGVLNLFSDGETPVHTILLPGLFK